MAIKNKIQVKNEREEVQGQQLYDDWVIFYLALLCELTHDKWQ